MKDRKYEKEYDMRKKLIAAVLAGAVLAACLPVQTFAEEEKTFVYGTTGYSEERGDAGLKPHETYSGGSAGRSGEGEALCQ